LEITMHATLATTSPLELGQVCMTHGVSDLVAIGRFNPIELLRRHRSGDWGDLSDSDKRQNDQATRKGDDRVMSAYAITPTLTVWVITEWDRTVTTLLLPSEY
jgi:hypothetical protein